MTQRERLAAFGPASISTGPCRSKSGANGTAPGSLFTTGESESNPSIADPEYVDVAAVALRRHNELATVG